VKFKGNGKRKTKT